MDTGSIVYILDHSDRIVSVHGPWDNFAEKNGGSCIDFNSIADRPLWEYIDGDPMRIWLSVLFQFSRLQNKAVQRDYRCDSPHLKRYMRMSIEPDAKNNLRVSHQLIKTEPRAVPVYINKGVKGKGNQPLMLRCGVCGKIELFNTWIEPQAEHKNSPGGLQVEYTVCQHCLAISSLESRPETSQLQEASELR